jgi:hypothetical protein
MIGCYIPPDEKKTWQKKPVKIPGYGPAKSVRNSLRVVFHRKIPGYHEYFTLKSEGPTKPGAS